MLTRWRRLGLILLFALSALQQAPTPAAADASSPWLPGPDAAGDDTYAGAIDSPMAGATIAFNANVLVQGWAVDSTATGWNGVDDVQVWLGAKDQGGVLLSRAALAQQRDDVAAATGNAFWANSGFTTTFANSGLAIGSNMLSVYIHAPAKGWWYRQVEVRIPAPPDRPYADDPLLIVREALPGLDIPQSTQTLTLRGYAIDRNMPAGTVLGVGGSGVSQLQIYLDGPRNGGAGTLLTSATLGQKNREATGFGDRFLMSGWEATIHPNAFSVDRHEFYIYALSAFWPTETLVILPFNVH